VFLEDLDPALVPLGSLNHATLGAALDRLNQLMPLAEAGAGQGLRGRRLGSGERAGGLARGKRAADPVRRPGRADAAHDAGGDRRGALITGPCARRRTARPCRSRLQPQNQTLPFCSAL
jgi:hypothetical protein